MELDDVDGLGPENINLDEPAYGKYVLAVHHWCDRPGPDYLGSPQGPATATVRLYLDGILTRSWQRTIASHERWYVADIDWTNGAIPPYVITDRDIIETVVFGCP